MADDYSRYTHLETRPNNPPVGLATPDTDGSKKKTQYAYDPHIAPSLNFDSERAAIDNLLNEMLPPPPPTNEEERELAKCEQETLKAALKALNDKLDPEQAKALKAQLERLERLEETLKTLHTAQRPFLEWTGKAERTSFEVSTVSLHVHERIDPAAILENARKPGVEAPQQGDLFNNPFSETPLREDIEFYRHERGWANRLIAGDSLLVMNSLLVKESMAGKVQMIYFDPPYGIKYGSNFQPFVNKRDVKDGADDDLTREPEQIRAFRDTWELGIHSYLTYLRDRLLLAKELLHESGSVFVQISDENLHHVREVMDEIFGSNNFIGLITITKTTGAGSPEIGTVTLPSISDYVIWFSRNRSRLKYHQLFRDKVAGDEGGSRYKPLKTHANRYATTSDIRSQSGGETTSFAIEYCGRSFLPAPMFWKTNNQGIKRLKLSRRLVVEGNTLRFLRFLEDFPASPLNNVWTDIGGIQSRTDSKIYVVQTASRLIERCLLMTTDPGDLVLDPTCGSGTTAFVAEKWGRRWITCDTSRVAVTLAKQRLMTASYDYYELRYPLEGLKGGFIYKTVPHVTLKSIANNPEIDEIYERDYPKIEAALLLLNKAVKKDFKEWDIPFEFPAGWPEKAQEPFKTFHAARLTMQKHMDESIARHANQETLYDQPKVDKKKARVTGPFTVEAVPSPTVLSLDETPPVTGETTAIARTGETARQHRWKDELMTTGIRGKDGQTYRFADLITLVGTNHLHTRGTLKDSGEPVAVSFGPEFAPLTKEQVSMALEEAQRLVPKPKFLIYAAFSFDPAAILEIDETHWPGVTLLKALMNDDLHTEDLKKKRTSDDSFWLIGQPEITLAKTTNDEWRAEVHGFDYFDIAKGEIRSGNKGNIAVWLLDTDYNGRSLLPTQVFFPMAGAKDGWSRLAKNLKAVLDESRIGAYHGTVSLPFKAGKYRRIAVKIVDDRGVESLVVRELKG
jgi:adenine-specific DNA-methyltransferase